MRKSTDDDGEHSEHRANPESYRDFCKKCDLPAQEEHSDKSSSNGHILLASSSQSWPEIRGIVSKSNHPGCDFQGSAQDELPDKKKCHQTAPSLMAVRLAKKMIAAAGTGQCSAEFAPDQTVVNYDKRPSQPTQHGLRSTHRSHQKRNGYEGADADHVRHIQCRCVK